MTNRKGQSSMRKHMKNIAAAASLSIVSVTFQGCASSTACAEVDSLFTLESAKDGVCLQCIYDQTGSDPTTLCLHANDVHFVCPCTKLLFHLQFL